MLDGVLKFAQPDLEGVSHGFVLTLSGGGEFQLDLNQVPNAVKAAVINRPGGIAVTVPAPEAWDQISLDGSVPASEPYGTYVVCETPATDSEYIYLRPAEKFIRDNAIIGYRIWRKRSDFRVTDGALALQVGNRTNSKQELLSFFTPPPGSGPVPSIDRNPYNFVALPKGGPWLEEPDTKTGRHYGHDSWYPNLLHGHIDLKFTARSPIFVPEYSSTASKEKADPPPQNFYRLNRWLEVDGKLARSRFYAIPGATLKGALRSMVEGLANDRFGALDDRKYYGMPIPYRRRAYSVGHAELVNGKWWVTEIRFDVDKHGRREYSSNLLAQPALHRKLREESQLPSPAPRYEIPAGVLNAYQENLEHPHYFHHFKNWKDQWSKQVEAGTKQRSNCKPNYNPDLSIGMCESKDGKLPQFLLQALKMPDQPVPEPIRLFFTLDKKTNTIDSFGRNLNYLWPSIFSIEKLAGDWFGCLPEDEKMGLGNALGLAERIFGFASNHAENGSHPFQGKLRFEPVWGPRETSPIPIDLAPLTSPQSRAKSRPLYLNGRNGRSASYSDPVQPELRGRKFYWKQRFNNGEVWQFHRKSTPAHAKGQCPSTINALPTGSVFTTRVHFENLGHAELGALLYTLLGFEPVVDTEGNWNSGSHCIHLGKGKPRGLGVCGVQGRITWFKPEQEYASLAARAQRPLAAQDEVEQARLSFANWCQAQAHDRGDAAAFEALHHIVDFRKLHTYPETDSVRYYPVNWKQYTWQPKDNANPDEPKDDKPRPTAMRPARELEP